MRKTGLIILTFLYLAFTAGVSVQRHYCMNRMAAIRFSSHHEDRCGYCGMDQSERSNTCCRDESATFKITDDQQPSVASELKLPNMLYLYSITVLTDQAPVLFNIAHEFQDHGPPGTSPVPLYVRNRIFRI